MPPTKIIGTSLPLFSLMAKNKKTKKQDDIMDNAMHFIDWLAKTNQNAWQLLPLHETQLVTGSKNKHVPSPYKSYGIGLDPMYLTEKTKRHIPSSAELNAFQKTNTWVRTYALFCAIRDEYGTDDWTKWEEKVKEMAPKEITKKEHKLKNEIAHYVREQWQLARAFRTLREHAKKNDIQLIGDIPFYIGCKSPLVWANQHLFQMHDGHMTVVSGAPSHERAYYGRQVWGHPLYHWDDASLWPEIVTLWKERIAYLSQFFHILRIDHANGFFHYGVIDTENESHDMFKVGPALPVFSKIIKYTRKIGLTVYAEDAGIFLQDLRSAMKKLRVPGMRIFKFAFHPKNNTIVNIYSDISSYPINSYAYTTTHDTEPLVAFLSDLSKKQQQRLCHETKINWSDDISMLAKRCRQKIIDSPSLTVLIPMQDWLLTTDRINTPGTEKEHDDHNWGYRLTTPIENLPLKLFDATLE